MDEDDAEDSPRGEMGWGERKGGEEGDGFEEFFGRGGRKERVIEGKGRVWKMRG